MLRLGREAYLGSGCTGGAACRYPSAGESPSHIEPATSS